MSGGGGGSKSAFGKAKANGLRTNNRFIHGHQNCYYLLEPVSDYDSCAFLYGNEYCVTAFTALNTYRIQWNTTGIRLTVELYFDSRNHSISILLYIGYYCASYETHSFQQK